MGNNSNNRDEYIDGDVVEFEEAGKDDPCFCASTKEGSTLLDVPYDCYGVITEFIFSFSDIISFMTSCHGIYDYFKNANVINRVTFTMNLEVKLLKPVDFVYRLRCLTIYSDNLQISHLQHFPNLKYLQVERSISLSSDIFPYFPILEELEIRGGTFQFNPETMTSLSQNIRSIFIRNFNIVCYRSKRFVSEKKIESEKDSFFSSVLLKRKKLVSLELWGFHFGKYDLKFLKNLESFSKLRKLSFRECQIPSTSDFSFFNNVKFNDILEELDISGLEVGSFVESGTKSKFGKWKFPNLRKLNIRLFNCGHFMKRMEICKSLQVLDISKSYKTINLDFIEKFPNLKHLTMKETEIVDSEIDMLQQFRKLESVVLTSNGIKYCNLNLIKRNVYGVQKVGKIRFLVM